MPEPVVVRPTLLIDEPDFRLVRHEFDGDGHVEHVLEVRNGRDAMGVERWRTYEINGTAMKGLFQYLIRIAEMETK